VVWGGSRGTTRPGTPLSSVGRNGGMSMKGRKGTLRNSSSVGCRYRDGE